MSSNKIYVVNGTLTLDYDFTIYATDADQAEEKAQDRIRLIVQTQKYPPSSTSIDTRQPVEQQ